MIRSRVLLDHLVRHGLTLGVFVNDIELTPATRPWHLSEPANYTRAALPATGWTITEVGIEASASYPETTACSFAGEAGPVYGYFLLDAAGVLVGGERFATPFSSTELGGSVSVTPRIVCRAG